MLYFLLKGTSIPQGQLTQKAQAESGTITFAPEALDMVCQGSECIWPCNKVKKMESQASS